MSSKVNRSAYGFLVSQDPVWIVVDSWRASSLVCSDANERQKRVCKALQCFRATLRRDLCRKRTHESCKITRYALTAWDART